MSDDSGFLGIVAALINRSRTKNALRRVQENNYENQGITHYSPSQIEAFFDETEPFGNMAFSGGLNSIRARAIARAAECAYIQGYSVIVLHCSNQELDNTLTSYFGNNYICSVNAGNPVYDPFWGMSNGEISRLILASTSKEYQINPVGKYYLDGISDFLRAKGIQPYCQMYITCPHLTLIDKINDSEAKGQITNNQARMILMQIMQGEIERGNIENFFLNFSSQAGALLAKKPMLKYAINVAIASQRKQIFAIDIQTSTNSLLINLLMSEAEMLVMRGRKVMVIADNIQQSDGNLLQNFLKKSSSNCSIVLSADDVFSSFGGEENAFFAFIGKCSRVILSKHSSAYSCQKWADYIGYYDKQEISTSYSQNANFVGHWGLSSTSSANVSVKRENIVKPEDIQRFEVNEALIINKSTGEKAFTRIV